MAYQLMVLTAATATAAAAVGAAEAAQSAAGAAVAAVAEVLAHQEVLLTFRSLCHPFLALLSTGFVFVPFLLRNSSIFGRQASSAGLVS